MYVHVHVHVPGAKCLYKLHERLQSPCANSISLASWEENSFSYLSWSSFLYHPLRIQYLDTSLYWFGPILSVRTPNATLLFHNSLPFMVCGAMTPIHRLSSIAIMDLLLIAAWYCISCVNFYLFIMCLKSIFMLIPLNILYILIK